MGGKDPMNREAIWLHGYRTDTVSKPLFIFQASASRYAPMDSGYLDADNR
jgi:hypothetical protein